MIIGATRGTGYEILNLLLRAGYPVRALARHAAKARPKLSPAVEIVEGDITKRHTLPPALRDVDHIISTTGVTKRPASERLVKATEYEGVTHTLAAGKATGFKGRFLYMTSLV